MPAKSQTRKRVDFAKLDGPPRMVGEVDIRLLQDIAAMLDPADVIVEFGPWLGALSVELAGAGDLHVVDNFVWTSDHDRRVPGLFAPGESFHPALEHVLKCRGLSATFHATEFADFRWNGGAIRLCVVDSPKTPDALKECLASVVGHLAPDALILVKNGLNAKLGPMMTFVEHLILEDVLRIDPSRAVRKSNVAVLRPGPKVATLVAMPSDPPIPAVPVAAAPAAKATTADNPFYLARMAQAVEAGEWQTAYTLLSALTSERQNRTEWERLEPTLKTAMARDLDRLGTFNEMVAVHNDKALYRKPVKAFHRSAAMTLRAFWLNNADKPWRGQAFSPEILTRAHEFGYMSWPSKVQDLVRGRDVMDIGCGPGLHGLGFLAAGAKSYVGMDPIVKPDQDRVKNLTAKRKGAFGWTPAEISDRIHPWTASAKAIEDHPPDRAFDVATLHNVTEHLHQLEMVIAETARRLRKGGILLYNHHNFYAWNGHHLPPKTVSAIDPDNESQLEMIDWGHVEYDPASEHYIARGLNRMRLDEILRITRAYFDIEVAEEIPSRPETGFDRLTDRVRARYPYLTDRDFLTQNLFCVARVRI